MRFYLVFLAAAIAFLAPGCAINTCHLFDAVADAGVDGNDLDAGSDGPITVTCPPGCSPNPPPQNGCPCVYGGGGCCAADGGTPALVEVCGLSPVPCPPYYSGVYQGTVPNACGGMGCATPGVWRICGSLTVQDFGASCDPLLACGGGRKPLATFATCDCGGGALYVCDL